MKDNLRKMELLAPAGNLETAVAALQAKADAVYLGLGNSMPATGLKISSPEIWQDCLSLPTVTVRRYTLR